MGGVCGEGNLCSIGIGSAAASATSLWLLLVPSSLLVCFDGETWDELFAV